MRVVEVSSYFDAAPEKVWEELRKSSTIGYISPRVMGFTMDGEPPEIWAIEGTTIELKLKALGVLPAGKHTINVERVDDAARSVQTQEHGGVIKSWRHLMTVEPEGSGTRYTDRVEIEAGAFDPVVERVARSLYRYRHKRWPELLRSGS